MHAVAAKAVALGRPATPAYQAYARQVIANAQALADGLAAEGHAAGLRRHRHPPVAASTCAPLGVTGAEAEARCDAARITLNKNAIPYDPQPPTIASGIRVGTPSVTTQGMGEGEMKEVASLIGRAVREPQAAAEVAAAVSNLVARFPIYPS